MNKIKISIALALLIGLTGCADDNYVSVRHGDDNAVEVTDEALEADNETADEDQAEENEKEKDTTKEASDNEEEETTSDGINYTVENVVNLRLAPSENSNVITTVEPGSTLLKLGDSDNWSRVTVDGQTGYIRSDLLIEK